MKTRTDAPPRSHAFPRTRAATLLCVAMAVSISAIAQSSPKPPYILADGHIQIVTPSTMAAAVSVWDTLFTASHPGLNFTVLPGDNYSAMAALTFNRTLIAPLGCEYTRIGLGDNLKIAAEPLALRVAHASPATGPGVPALGIIVNPANPLSQLTMAQLASIFTVGAPNGDIALWSQAGVDGPLASQTIHPAGPIPSDYTNSEDPQAGEFLSTTKFNTLNMNHTYIGVPRYADVVRRVEQDPAAIGIVALNQIKPGVKVIALKRNPGSPASSGSPAEITAGRYPLDRYVFLYLRLGKGMPLDPLARDYASMALTPEGQQALVSQGYLPLNAAELAEERAKLDR